MNAEPDAQLRLLDLQGLDARLDQLAYQRRSLPELARAAEIGARLAAVRDRGVAARAETSDLERAQTKADLDVEQVRTRARRDQELLDSGRLTSGKELENLQHEIASLARRQSDLEDVELEIMERLEGARAAADELETQRAALAAELAEVEQARDDAQADIDGDARMAQAERDRLAPAIPADLSALYERLRADRGGVGAARLHRGTCEGCRMQLTPTYLAGLRAASPDSVQRCEECGRILVRTAESGL